jgi:hypothetical protein
MMLWQQPLGFLPDAQNMRWEPGWDAEAEPMALDLWFREDVARILTSTYETMVSTSVAMGAARPELTAAYQQGFSDALRAVGMAFGVAIPTSVRDDGNRRIVHLLDVQELPVKGHGLPSLTDRTYAVDR